MYLMKYIAVALVFFAALLYAIRSCRSTSLLTPRGKLGRAVLSLLALSLLGVVWYYSGDKHFSGIKVKYVARTASLLLYLYALPDIWADGKAAEPPAPANVPAADDTAAPSADDTAAPPAETDKADCVPDYATTARTKDAQTKGTQTKDTQTKDETDRV